MKWAEVGKVATFFHNGGASETYFGTSWYQAYPQGEWWGMSHGEPFLLRSYAGKPEKMAAAVKELLAGQEVVVPCMVDGDKRSPMHHEATASLDQMDDDVAVVSYRAGSGYTLTVVLDLADFRMIGFGSNSEMWSRQEGRFDLA